jgi:hypothetical protein
MQSSLSKPNPDTIDSIMEGGHEGLVEAIRDPKLTVPDGLSFRFLTFTKLHEHRDKRIRNYIRSHAQSNYQAKRRALNKKRPSVIVPIAPATSRQASSLASAPSPVTYLAAGQADPFSTLPISLLETDRFVLNRCKCDTTEGIEYWFD